MRSILNDLCESGLVFRLGRGQATAYRAARRGACEAPLRKARSASLSANESWRRRHARVRVFDVELDVSAPRRG